MQYKDAFSSYHPSVNFLYFGLVLAISMFFMHPVCLFISFLGSLIYYIKLKGMSSFLGMLKFILPIIIFTSIINPLFNHSGVTVLSYFPSGNPLTLESIIYGFASAVLLINMLLWFGCYNEIMTSDKFIYLFGRVIPHLSLVLSMTLRFVPRFKKQFNEVKLSQRALGKATDEGRLFERLKNIFSCFSIMVTWSLENAIETSDSMRSRGYGLKGRTAFSIYEITKRDIFVLGYLIVLGVIFFVLAAVGGLKWSYFPSATGEILNYKTIMGEAVFLLISATPIIIDVCEERKWQLLKSKI